jgi:hypothetical protein
MYSIYEVLSNFYRNFFCLSNIFDMGGVSVWHESRFIVGKMFCMEFMFYYKLWGLCKAEFYIFI